MNNSRTQPLSILKMFLLYFKETELRKGARVGVVVVHSISICSSVFLLLRTEEESNQSWEGGGGVGTLSTRTITDRPKSSPVSLFLTHCAQWGQFELLRPFCYQNKRFR